MTDIFDLDGDSAACTYDNISALMPETPWLNELNPEQKQAVTCTDGPLLVLSGAGTGKTKVLTTRLAYILAQRKAAPWNCLVVTFTNRAAREMTQRARNMIGDMVDAVWMGTFHGICVKILRRNKKRKEAAECSSLICIVIHCLNVIFKINRCVKTIFKLIYRELRKPEA